MTETSRETALPRPFYSEGWPTTKAAPARVLWDFHAALVDAKAPALDGEDLTAYFDAEREQALARRPLGLVPETLSARVYKVVETFKIPHENIGNQIAAARLFKESIRFVDSSEVGAFIGEWAHTHARSLSHVAGVTGSWQLAYVDELATAFFWVGRLVTLKRDLRRDRLFIPQSDLDQAGLTVDDLRTGTVTEPVRRLLWKQSIRAKNAFAASEPLVRDLPKPYSAAVKRWWVGGLEVLNEIARRDYDVWSEPITLSKFHMLQVRLQARIGTTTFLSRR